MNRSFFIRPTLFIVAAAVIAACSSGGGTTTTTSAPTPSAAPSSRPATTAAAAPDSGPTSAEVTPAMITLGDSIFHAASCQRCHGPDAKGARNGRSLLGPTFLHIQGSGTYSDFLNVIMSGVPADSIKDKSHQIAMRARDGGQTHRSPTIRSKRSPRTSIP